MIPTSRHYEAHDASPSNSACHICRGCFYWLLFLRLVGDRPSGRSPLLPLYPVVIRVFCNWFVLQRRTIAMMTMLRCEHTCSFGLLYLIRLNYYEPCQSKLLNFYFMINHHPLNCLGVCTSQPSPSPHRHSIHHKDRSDAMVGKSTLAANSLKTTSLASKRTKSGSLSVPYASCETCRGLEQRLSIACNTELESHGS